MTVTDNGIRRVHHLQDAVGDIRISLGEPDLRVTGLVQLM